MRHDEPAHVLDRHDAQSIVLRTENAVTRCHWIPTAVTQLSEKHGYGTKKCSVHHALRLWGLQKGCGATRMLPRCELLAACNKNAVFTFK